MSAAMSDRRARIKVPVMEVAFGAFRGVFGHLELMLDLGWLPFLVLLPLRLAPLFAAHYLPSGAFQGPLLVATGLGEQAATFLCLTLFAVRWHQALLFTKPFTPPRRLITQAWARFVAYSLLFYVVTAPPLFAAAASGIDPDRIIGGVDPATLGVAAAGLALVASLVTARLSLLFPAAAFGEPLGPGAAWQRMRGNTWRIVAALFLALLPIMAAEIVLVSGSLGPSPADHLVAPPLIQLVPLVVLELVLDFLAVALGASVFSAFYQRLVLRRDGRRIG